MDLLNQLEEDKVPRKAALATVDSDSETEGATQASQFEFNKLSIFKEDTQGDTQKVETESSVNVLSGQKSQEPNLSLLGLNPGILDGIMNRLNGEKVGDKTQEKTQEKTQVLATQVVETQKNMQSVTQIDKTQSETQVVEKTQEVTQTVPMTQTVPVTQTVPLTQTLPIATPAAPSNPIAESTQAFWKGIEDSDDDDDEIVTRHKRMAAISEDEEDADVAETSIEHYENMSREERIKARIEQKEKKREAKRKREEEEKAERVESAEKEQPVETVKHATPAKQRKTKTSKLAEAFKQNELIKKSGYMVKKVNKEKFAASKLIAAFNEDSESDSDEGVFSSEVGHVTPQSSPKEVVAVTEKPVTLPTSGPLGKYQEKLKEAASEKNGRVVISLDSDDSDSEEQSVHPSTQADKLNIIEMKRRVSKRRHNAGSAHKKRGVGAMIREESRRQLRKFSEERKQRETPQQQQQVADENELMKMMAAEMDMDRRLGEREREKNKRSKMILEGQLPVDEGMDESEEENEGSDVDEESESEVEEVKKPKKSFLDISDDDDDNEDLSLSALFAQTLPQDETVQNLKGADAFRKLQGRHQMEEEDDEDDDEESQLIQPISTQKIATQSYPSQSFATQSQTQDESQVIRKNAVLLESQNFLPDTQADAESDGDADVEDGVVLTRKRAHQEVEEIDSDSSSDDEVIYEDEKSRLERLRITREAERRGEERRKARIQAYKEAGMADIIENEAVESEDEWQGVGGADGEREDRANSEDEKILDDSAGVKVNEDSIRAFLAKKDMAADEDMVKKIYKDLKTHAFRQRRAHDGAYELELSDDEDQYVREMQEHRMQEYVQRQYLQNANIKELAKNDKYSAFYQTITTDSLRSASIDFEDKMEDEDKVVDEDSPFKEPEEAEKKKDDEEEEFVRPAKKRKLTPTQVHSMMSFLDEESDDDVVEMVDLGSDEEDVDDIKYLKKHSKVRHLVAPQTVNLVDEVPEPGSREDEFDGGVGLLASQRHSITASFRQREQKKARYSSTTGNEMHEVKVTVGSRPVGREKTSVRALDKNHARRRQIKSSKVAKIEQTLRAAPNNSLRKLYARMSGFS